MSSEAATYFAGSLEEASANRLLARREPGFISETRSHLTGASQTAPEPQTSIGEISDETLLVQVAEGAKEALASLFRRHAHSVRNVAYRILRNEAEADDLVQDIFVFLFRKAVQFDPTRGSAVSWIIQISYHRAFDRRRRLNAQHFYVSHELDDSHLNVTDIRLDAPFSEPSLESIWGRESAERLRELLSPSQLATIELHFFEGYTLEEIAERLGQTVGNIRNHYYRGLEKLRKPSFAGKLRSK